MNFLFSGEGFTDLGGGLSDALICEGENYLAGPMTFIADKVVEANHRYSPLEAGCCGYVSAEGLSQRRRT